MVKNGFCLGSGCGSDVRVVATSDSRGSNPVIGKIYISHLTTVNSTEKTKIKKKRPRTAHSKKNLGLSAVHRNKILLLLFKAKNVKK